MLMGLIGRAGQPATRSAIGCAALARRTSSSIHRHPRAAECSAAALSIAAVRVRAIGRRRAPAHLHPR